MYDQVNPEVYVYAPEGSDVTEHLKKIDGYKHPDRESDKLERGGLPGGLIISKRCWPRNRAMLWCLQAITVSKTEYIKKSVEAGLNVLSDKPMVISPENFPLLEESFKIAKEKGSDIVRYYDRKT